MAQKREVVIIFLTVEWLLPRQSECCPYLPSAVVAGYMVVVPLSR